MYFSKTNFILLVVFHTWLVFFCDASEISSSTANPNDLPLVTGPPTRTVLSSSTPQREAANQKALKADSKLSANVSTKSMPAIPANSINVGPEPLPISSSTLVPPPLTSTVPPNSTTENPNKTTTATPPITTVTPKTTTVFPNTTIVPNTTTTTTTVMPNTTTIIPPTPNTTTTVAPTTTPTTTTVAPRTTPKPEPDRKFDGPSFIGGMILTMGLMAIAFVSWKFYKARTERNYHTL